MDINLPDIKNINLDDIEKRYCIDANSKHKKPPVLHYILQGNEEYPILTKGSFSAWKGQAKGRKSTVMTLLDASFTQRPLPLLNKIYCSKGANSMLHFDTEEAPHEVYKIYKRVDELTKGNERTGFNLYYLRPFHPHERFDIITRMIEKYSGSIDFVVIDGILDLVTEMNSEEQATDLVSWLLKMTENHNIHIACIIHENYASEKASGHVGSYILRKAETIISINKYKHDKKLSTVEPSMMRSQHFDTFFVGIDRNDLPYIDSTETKSDF